MDNHIAVADEIWKELIEASSVEPPLLIKPYLSLIGLLISTRQVIFLESSNLLVLLILK